MDAGLSVAPVIAAVTARADVLDLAVREPDITDIVRDLYDAARVAREPHGPAGPQR